MRSLLIGLLVTAAASPAFADRPRDIVVARPLASDAFPAVSSNVIYLNNCEPGGCVVRYGNTDSRTDHSSIGQGTLTKFGYDDATWQKVVQCMKDVFEPYNIQITDQDPGSADHLEIMIAGSPGDIGLPADVGGIAEQTCASYQPDTLVFDFANVWQGNVEQICSTAAQEIAHTWGLDHTIVASDPLTYFKYAGRRYYSTSPEQCGSDCVNGTSPPPARTCTGTDQQEHTCRCSGQNTQDPDSVINSVFGAGTPKPPTVTLTKPKDGDQVMPGFAVDADATNDYGNLVKAELRVDGNLISTTTSMPYVFNAPTTLGDGTHHVEVTVYDRLGTAGKAAADVIIGPPCTKPSDCANNTDTCIGGRCVPGPGVQGGLGQPCTTGTDCASGNCSSDGTNMYCTDSCTVGQCPQNFGCVVSTGQTTGVCWPGFDDGSGHGGGGCSTGGGGPIGLGLLFGALLLARKRR